MRAICLSGGYEDDDDQVRRCCADWGLPSRRRNGAPTQLLMHAWRRPLAHPCCTHSAVAWTCCPATLPPTNQLASACNQPSVHRPGAQGDWLVYTGMGGRGDHRGQARDQEWTAGNAALRENHLRGLPVRVCRQLPAEEQVRLANDLSLSDQVRTLRQELDILIHARPAWGCR